MKGDIERLTAEAVERITRIGAHAADEVESHRVQIDNLCAAVRELKVLPAKLEAELRDRHVELEMFAAMLEQGEAHVRRLERALVAQAWAHAIALLHDGFSPAPDVAATLPAPLDFISPPAPAVLGSKETVMIAVRKEEQEFTQITDEVRAEVIPISKLHPSPMNERKTFGDSSDLDSMATVGLIHPLRVRPSAKKHGDFEIVCGERRYRKAKELKWTEVRCEVQSLTDHQAREINIIENLARADVPPLEEAEAFETLTKELGVPVAELAARIHKSKEYIAQRVKLLALCIEARTALSKGDLLLGAAQFLCRLVSHDEQRELLPELAANVKPVKQYGRMLDEPASLGKAEDLVLRQMRLLKDASFKIEDAQLVPAAGACTVCTKQTGLQPELFGVVTKANAACTDGACWAQKINANAAIKLAAVKAKGLPIIERKPDKPSIWKQEHDGWHLKDSAPYVDLDERKYFTYPLGNMTWREVMKGTDVEVKHDVDDAGKPHELVSKAKASARVDELIKEKEKARNSKKKTPASQKAKMPSLKDRVEEAKRTAVLAAVAAAGAKRQVVILRTACLDSTDGGTYNARSGDLVAKRRGMKSGADLEAAIEKMKDVGELVGLLAELRVAGDPHMAEEYEGDLGLDLANIEEEAEEAETEKFGNEKAAASAKPLAKSTPAPKKKAKR